MMRQKSQNAQASEIAKKTEVIKDVRFIAKDHRVILQLISFSTGNFARYSC